MQARRLLALHGWHWLRDGFRLWRKNAAFLSFLVFSYLLILVLASAVPRIGHLIFALISPALSLGVLDGCRLADEKKQPGLDNLFPMLFSGFRRERNFPMLAAVGAINMAACFLVLALSTLIDGGLFRDIVANTRQLDETIALTPAFQIAMLLATALLAIVQMAYWFAPPLVGWWRLPAPKAMFFSLLACLRNWRAFMVYSLATIVAGVLIPALAIGIVQTLVAGLGALLLLIYLSIAIPVLAASFYFSIQSIFGLPESPPGP
jgi:hypothetical protein